jgi:uncharacterized membrane protein YhhN
MTRAAWLLLALAAAFAVIDWIGVVHVDRRLRWIGKPGAILLLIGVALALQPVSSGQRSIFVAALFLSFLGDLQLMLPHDRWFMAGLAAFLAAHLAYIDGFLLHGVDGRLLVYSVAGVAVVSLAVGGWIVAAVLKSRRQAVVAPVSLYLLAISAMVALAGGTGRPLAIGGAVLFYISDGLIAWNRFVRPLSWSALPVIVTYHFAQALLVLSLAG